MRKSQHDGDALKLFDRLCSLKFHQFMAVAGFQPVDAAVGNTEAHQVMVRQFGDEGCPKAFARFAAGVAGGDMSLLLKAAGESLEAQHQVDYHGSILLSQAGKHGENRMMS